MQAKIAVTVFCILAVILIEVNHGAPTGHKNPSHTDEGETKIEPSADTKDVNRKRVKPGSRTTWSTSPSSKHTQLFSEYKTIISKKLRETHKLPPSFDPKPVKYSTQVVSGTLYHYLIPVPKNKFAHVTISHRPWLKMKTPNEQQVTVRPKLYSVNDLI